MANIYLHEVIDDWFVREVQPRLQGESELIRYADDLVFVFVRKEDAERVLEVLPKRFGKYGLALQPDKTADGQGSLQPHAAPHPKLVQTASA